jgi:hypothetical protein
LDLYTHPEQPQYRISPAKQKLDQELLIHSLNVRKENKAEARGERQNWEMAPPRDFKEDKLTPTEERYYHGSEREEGRKSNDDFGGVLNGPL